MAKTETPITVVYLIAMPDECAGIFDLKNWVKHEVYGFVSYQRGTEVIVITGIGKSNAAAGMQYALQSYQADMYINLGLVGSFSSELPVGQIAVAHSATFFDVDVTAFGYEPGQLPKSLYTSYPLSLSHPHIADLPQIHVVSGDTFLQEELHKTHISETFLPDVVDMELASLAHVCHLHGCLAKLTAVKAISDHINEQSTTDFKHNMAMGLQALREWVERN